MWWYWEVGLHDGTSVLLRGGRDQTPLPLSCDDTCFICKPERGPSLRTKSASTLISDFQSPKLWETNACCLNPPVLVFCYSGLSWPSQWATWQASKRAKEWMQGFLRPKLETGTYFFHFILLAECVLRQLRFGVQGSRAHHLRGRTGKSCCKSPAGKKKKDENYDLFCYQSTNIIKLRNQSFRVRKIQVWN